MYVTSLLAHTIIFVKDTIANLFQDQDKLRIYMYW